MSDFEKWKAYIRGAEGKLTWDEYDCDLQAAVSLFNTHLKSTAGYRQLDWKIIKAMLWVETGAGSAQWKTKPLQIGVKGDPGLAALLGKTEGGELILPPSLQGKLTSVTTVPSQNIRAGIGYLLMRMANFEHRTIASSDTKVYEIKVVAGDSLDKIAKKNGTTIDVLQSMNEKTAVLRIGQVLKFTKASIQRVITSWRVISNKLIAERYNGGGDTRYAEKLDFVALQIAGRKDVICAP